MTKDYSNMTLDALRKLSTQLAEKRNKLSIEHKQIANAIDAKLAEKSAQEKFDAMSPAEKTAIQSIGQSD